MSKTSVTNKKVGGLTLPNVKVYYIATIIKTQGEALKSTEHNPEPRSKSTHICLTDF